MMNALDLSNGQPYLLDASIVALRTAMLENSHMSKPVNDPPTYAALLALKPDELALGRWASEAKLARNYFNDLRGHGNPGEETLRKLLAVIGKTMADYDREKARLSGTVLSEVASIPGSPRSVFHGERLPDLEVIGTAMGGEFGDLDSDIELTELHMDEVIDRVARPVALANDPKAYALRIIGDSMAPRFKPGERVSVNPKATVSVGDDVIVQLRGHDGDDGERIKMVLIKELVRFTATFVELRQHNPSTIFRVERKRVAHIHVVRANYF
jgi:phage repressor protein C with HTH and peptisase S24 domain